MIGGRLRARLEQPIAENDRRRAFGIAAAVLVVAALALSLTASDGDRGGQLSDAGARGGQLEDAVAPILRQPRPPASVPSAAQLVARRFLVGYLAYLHGRGTTKAIDAASPELRDKLAASPPRVPPANRHRHPRVVGIDGYALDRRRWLATATIADEGVADYRVAVVVTQRASGPVVTRIGGD